MDTVSPGAPQGVLTRVCAWLERVAMALLAVMTLLVLLQIVGRDVMQAGWAWADELARYTGLAVVYLTVPLLLQQDRHVKVDLLSSRLAGRPAALLHLCNELLTVMFCAMFLWGAWRFMQKASGFSTPALGLPNWLYYLPAMVGMVMFTVVALRRLVSALRGQPQEHAVLVETAT
jgi:TRAP-type transport system small permease protein